MIMEQSKSLAPHTGEVGVTFYDTEKKFVFDFEHDECDDKALFIRKSVDATHKKINLYNYDVVVFPKMRSRECQYMSCYIYRFNQPRLCNYEDILGKPVSEEICAKIRQKKVLVIDDFATSGSTLKEVLRTLRILNGDNEIIIFSLIGRKDILKKSCSDHSV